jgi:hypothetical protein
VGSLLPVFGLLHRCSQRALLHPRTHAHLGARLRVLQRLPDCDLAQSYGDTTATPSSSGSVYSLSLVHGLLHRCSQRALVPTHPTPPAPTHPDSFRCCGKQGVLAIAGVTVRHLTTMAEFIASGGQMSLMVAVDVSAASLRTPPLPRLLFSRGKPRPVCCTRWHVRSRSS